MSLVTNLIPNPKSLIPNHPSLIPPTISSENITANLSRNAESFTSQYNRTGNFIQRYNIWTDYLDRYATSGTFAYDLGCGPGIFSFYLAKKGVETEGWDGADGMIQICGKEKLRLNIQNVSFRKQQLPVKNTGDLKQASLIISSSVIEYIEDVESMIKMCFDMLIPGGTLLISFPNSTSWYRQFEKVSFKILRRPGYFKFVKNLWTLKKAKALFSAHAFQYLEHSYYADRSIIGKIATLTAGKAQAGALLIVAFQKPA